MINMRIVCVFLTFIKVASELSGPFAKIEAPQAGKDCSNPPEFFHKNVFLAKSFYWNILYSYGKYLVNLSWL